MARTGSKKTTMMKARGAGSSPKIIIVSSYTPILSFPTVSQYVYVGGYTCLHNAKMLGNPLTRPIGRKGGIRPPLSLHRFFFFFCLLAPPIHLSYVNEGNELNFVPLPLVGCGCDGKACKKLKLLLSADFCEPLQKLT